MELVAYLVNRYPEVSLPTIRREIHGVECAGITVLRFAHRPSTQPLASARDRAESERTEYLATGGIKSFLIPILQVLLTRPARFVKALGLLNCLQLANLKGLSYLALACRLQRRLAKLKVGHLHVHFAQSSAIVSMLTNVVGGPRWTMTVHGPEDIDPSHRRTLSILVRHASATVAISNLTGVAIRQAALPEVVRIEVVRMGVDGRYLSDTPVCAREISISCVARLESRKGHTVLLEALEVIRRQGLTPRVDLVGDGPHRALLEAEVRMRGLSDQVRFLGWLSEDEVVESLDRSAFLVLPSLDEGLPVAIMEAFARARPVIASDVAAVSELVRSGTNGHLVDAGDAQALACAIREYCHMSSALLFELGMSGRELVRRNYDSASNSRMLVQLWRELSA